MKREHWYLVAGLCLGLILGGSNCSLKISQSPAALASQAVGVKDE